MVAVNATSTDKIVLAVLLPKGKGNTAVDKQSKEEKFVVVNSCNKYHHFYHGTDITSTEEKTQRQICRQQQFNKTVWLINDINNIVDKGNAAAATTIIPKKRN